MPISYPRMRATATRLISGNGATWQITRPGKVEVIAGVEHVQPEQQLSAVGVRTDYATNGEFRGTVYATDGDFQGTVYANKIVGNISESKMYPAFSQGGNSSNSMTINYAGNPRLPVRVSIFFTINGYSAGTRFWINGEEQTGRGAGKSYGYSFDLGAGAGLTITLRASGSGSITTSPIIAIVTPQGTAFS